MLIRVHGGWKKCMITVLQMGMLTFCTLVGGKFEVFRLIYFMQKLLRCITVMCMNDIVLQTTLLTFCT